MMSVTEGGRDVRKFGESSDLVKCSFCGKTQKQVGKLIAGPGVYICNECIKLCNDVIDEEGIENPEASETPLTDDQLHWRETQRVLAERLGRRPTVAELAVELGWTEERVTEAGRGAWMATATAASTGADPAGMAGALREVKRELDRLARRVAGLADHARGDDSTD
jgi:hypothetical protein